MLYTVFRQISNFLYQMLQHSKKKQISLNALCEWYIAMHGNHSREPLVHHITTYKFKNITPFVYVHALNKRCWNLISKKKYFWSIIYEMNSCKRVKRMKSTRFNFRFHSMDTAQIYILLVAFFVGLTQTNIFTSFLLLYRNGMITNWNGIRMIMAVSTHCMYHRSIFGCQTLFCITSEYISSYHHHY